MKLKPYPEYKDSGVPWLGQVPEHWEVVPLKRLAWFKGGAGFPVEEQGQRDLDVPFFKVSDMNLPGNEKVMSVWNNAVSRDTAARLGATVLPAGTIVFPKVGGAMLTNKRRVVECPCCVDNNLMGCVVRRGDSNFVFLLLRMIDLGTIAKPGPVPAISEGEVREIRVIFPPLPEQSAIVRFLDHADHRINRFIRAKRRLIELLNEQKQAIIYRAVIRGLDPNVRLKPSGVEWLGEVPEHWEVKRNGQLFTQRNQTGFAELPILEVSLKTGVRVRGFESTTRKQVMSDREKYKRAAKGDIAYNMMRLWQGAVGVAPVDGLVSPAYVVARPLADVEVRYFSNLFRTAAYMSEVDNSSRGIVKDRNRLYWEDFKQIHSPYPPLGEQTQIADAIDKSTQSVNYAIDQIECEIDLLREYRTRLIADVVTGKLDVRGVIEAGNGPSSSSGPYPSLPDEAEELDDLDPGEDTEAEEIIDTEETTWNDR